VNRTTSGKSRRLHLQLSVSSLVLCLATAGGVALPGCGGDEPDSAANGLNSTTTNEAMTTAETNGGNSADSVLLKCDKNGDCADAPDECEESKECLAVNCGQESGGCVPAIGKNGVGLFGTHDSLRLCFHVEVVQTDREPSTSGQSQTATTQATTTAAETDTTEPTQTDTTTTETTGPETPDATNTTTSAATNQTTAKCSGPSFPLSGIDRTKIEDKLQISSDGRIVWSQEEISLRGKIVNGEFRVTGQP
jgi:hypothetical protein